MARKRSYPHVGSIGDAASRQSQRLLWDRYYDLLDQIDAQGETTAGHAATLATVQATLTQTARDARAALALSSRTESVTLPPGGSGAGSGSGGGSGGSGGDGTDDAGQGAAGCAACGSTGHLDAGADLTAFHAGMIICGTAQEFPSLLAVTVDQATRDANQVALQGRMIWHLQHAGFNAGKQRNPSGVIGIDKITVQIDGTWLVYDCFTGPPYTEALEVHVQLTSPADPVPDGGIAD